VKRGGTSCIACASLKTGAPKLSAALIFLWLLSFYQEKESDVKLGEQKMNKAYFKTKKVTMNRVRGSAPIKENLPYFCLTKQRHNAKQSFHL
jgi:hypothetical protein